MQRSEWPYAFGFSEQASFDARVADRAGYMHIAAIALLPLTLIFAGFMVGPAEAGTHNTTATTGITITNQDYNVDVGYGTTSTSNKGSYNTNLGYSAGYSATGEQNTFLGDYTGISLTGSQNTLVGNDISTDTNIPLSGNVVVGQSGFVESNSAVAIGQAAHVADGSDGGIAIGINSSVASNISGGIAIGTDTTSAANNAIAIGDGANNSTPYTVQFAPPTRDQQRPISLDSI